MMVCTILNLNIFESGVSKSTILEEQVILTFNLIDEKHNANTIINNQVRFVTLTIIL